jgi:hypothetical protein
MSYLTDIQTVFPEIAWHLPGLVPVRVHVWNWFSGVYCFRYRVCIGFHGLKRDDYF